MQVHGAHPWSSQCRALRDGFTEEPTSHLSFGAQAGFRVPAALPPQRRWLDLPSRNTPGTSETLPQVIAGNKSLQHAPRGGAQGSLRRASAAARALFARGISTNTTVALGFEPKPTHANTL